MVYRDEESFERDYVFIKGIGSGGFAIVTEWERKEDKKSIIKKTFEDHINTPNDL